MAENFNKRMQRAKESIRHLRQKLVVRVWNLGSRLDPKQIRRENKKRKGR